jgi:MoaA/NifB/PqqE/SkfB family radical SAM enzyme
VQFCDAITVSLDGTNAATYQAIRGLDAFDKVCEGVRAVAARGTAVSLRVTLQRTNYQQLPAFVELARELGVRQVSFLGVDVGNPHAFARTEPFTDQLALTPADLPLFAELIDQLEREYPREFHTGFIAESPAKLRRIHQYFAALNGAEAFPRVRCNAPEFSAVIGADARVAPCFFIPGPGATTHGGLTAALAAEKMVQLRGAIRAGERGECTRCVCSMWRDPATFGSEDFLLPARQHA